MASTVYIGVDPGETTGVAAVYYAPGKAAPEWWEVYQVAYTNGPVGTIRGLVEAAILGAHDASALVIRIVAEQFIMEEGTHGVDTTALRVLGALEYLVDRLFFEHPWLNLDYTTQLRTVKKSLPDKRLKMLEMHSPGQPHANDAMRHVVINILDQKKGTLAAHDMAIRAFPPDVAEG